MKICHRSWVLFSILIFSFCLGAGENENTGRLNWPEVRAKTEAMLLKRAKEKVSVIPKVENWDEAADLALDLRARSLLLKKKSGLDLESSNTILLACQNLSETILNYEASRDLFKKSGILRDTAVRGWGTAQTVTLPGIRVSNVLDLTHTSAVLLSLAEYLSLARGVHESHYEQVLGTAVEVLDYWIQFFMEEHPVYGPYFCRLGISGEAVRGFLIYHANARMAMTLYLVSRELRERGLEKRAGDFETLALRLGRQIQTGVVNADVWVHGMAQVKSNAIPQRSEDVGHASAVLEMINLFQKNNLNYGGKPLFRNADLVKFKDVLTNQVWVRDEQGRVSYRIYFDEDDFKKSNGRMRDAGVRFAPPETNTLSNKSGAATKKWGSATAWHRYVGGKDRSVDTGASLRSSWGWVHAAKTDEATFTQLFRYLSAYFGFWKETRLASNSFLTLARFWSASLEL